MFSRQKSNIIVTIGSHKVIVAHQGKSGLKDKFFIDELNDETKKKLTDFFTKNKSTPIYVLLDTIEQSYKRKTYPNIRESQFSIRRDLALEGDKTSLKSYLVLKNPSGKRTPGNKMDCLLVAASINENVSKWIEFISDSPNRVVGIYLLPIEFSEICVLLEKIESTAAAKAEKESAAAAKKSSTATTNKLIKGDSAKSTGEHVIEVKPIEKKAKGFGINHPKAKPENVYYFTIQTKASGVRQIVLSKSGVIFTRIININPTNPNFVEDYEKDLRNTLEYLRRILPDVTPSQLKIINILPSSVIEKLAAIKADDLHIKNYNSVSMAKELGYETSVQDEEFCDLLASRIFSQGKMLLKFTTKKIALFERFVLGLKSLVVASVLLLIAIIVVSIITFLNKTKNTDLLEQEEVKKVAIVQELGGFKKSLLEEAQGSENIETSEIERIIEIGKIDDVLGPLSQDFRTFYEDIKFLKKFQIVLNNLSYSTSSFNSKDPSSEITYTLGFSGKISNDSGDIEDFFKEFDKMDNEVKKSLAVKYDVKHSDLPRNIDFTQKYYDFPIDFRITKKQK